MFGLEMSPYGNLTNASLAYLPYMPYQPFGITNFGGDLQIFPVPDYRRSQIGLVFNQAAQQTGWPAGFYYGYQTNPGIDQNFVVSQASAMAAQSLNQLASQEINTALQAITGQKAKINAQLQAKDIKDEDKAKLEKQLKELEELEKEINDLKTSNTDPQSAYQKANELRLAVNNVIQGKDNGAQGSSTSGSSGSSGSSSSSGSSDSSGSSSSKTEPKSFAPWCDAFHDATFKWGTDDDVFNACCDEMTKDDVVERMIQWNQSYPGESFMEVFMADADSDQKLKYGRQIQRALRDKAQELGIDLSKDPDYIAITKELNSMLYIDNGVADNFNALVKKLAAKMGYQYDYKNYSMT